MNKTLPLSTITKKVNHQHDRLQMLGELNDMVIDSMPYSTDSDKPLALLNGMKAMISTDCADMQWLFESLQADHPNPKKPADTGRAITTRENQFNPTTPLAGPGALFSVREGVKASDALDQLSLLLSAVHEALGVLADEKGQSNEATPLWGIFYNVTAALAVTESLNRGLIESDAATSA